MWRQRDVLEHFVEMLNASSNVEGHSAVIEGDCAVRVLSSPFLSPVETNELTDGG